MIHLSYDVITQKNFNLELSDVPQSHTYFVSDFQYIVSVQRTRKSAQLKTRYNYNKVEI